MDAVWTIGISLSKQIGIDVAYIRGKEYRYVLISNKDSKTSLEKDIQNNINNIEKDIRAYKATIVLDEDKKLESDLKTQWMAYKNINCSSICICFSIKHGYKLLTWHKYIETNVRHVPNLKG